jgi:hypothetical protein
MQIVDVFILRPEKCGDRKCSRTEDRLRKRAGWPGLSHISGKKSTAMAEQWLAGDKPNFPQT